MRGAILMASPALPRVACIGASGFIGRHLASRLDADGWPIRRIGRGVGGVPVDTAVPDFAAADWSEILDGIEVVVHAAARVHVRESKPKGPGCEFMRVNRDLTRSIAEQAARAGVRRFVFISTLGVLGSESPPGSPLGAGAPVRPESDYARSKLAAEAALRTIAERTGLEVVVVRPPMVYGREAPGNFSRLSRLVCRGVPLPFTSIRNRRSFVGIENLVEMLVACIAHPRAAGRPLLVSDGEDLSTPDLVRRIAKAMGVRARLFRMPVQALRWAGRLAGCEDAISRIAGTLQVDIGETRAVLDWTPRVSVDDGLRRALSHE